ncbi:MAG TPA: LysR substrate-binding domain-containing protein, partial [Polyangiales bacterium]|nr:LysR substrate-binding domain-containing protein [Polyangiales bacterium]
KLLIRTTRKLALTSEGALFYEHCDALLKCAERAYEAVSGASEVARGSVRINAPVTFAQLHLARAIAGFLREQPEIDVQLSGDDGMVDVADGGFDLVVRVTRQPPESLIARKLASTQLVVCGAPDYFARAGRPAAPDELVHHQCLHYTRVPFAAEWRFRGPDGPYVVPARSSFASGDGTVLKQAALAGLGLVVLPWFMVAREVEAGTLALTLQGQRRAQIGIYALYAHKKLPLRTRLVLNHLSAWFGREGWER